MVGEKKKLIRFKRAFQSDYKKSNQNPTVDYWVDAQSLGAFENWIHN